MEIKNAKITGTFLGYEDHGILTCFLHLDCGDSGQSFGGYFLESYGLPMLKEIMKVIGVVSWEELCGEYIRVKIGDNRLIQSIGHITKDIWYTPKTK